MATQTYSFADCQAAIKGPNGSFGLSQGAAPSEEGITISDIDDKSTLTMGADGSGMHSLHMSKAGTVTIRLLKTSPVNAQLMDMYNADTSSAAVFGRNTITVRDPVRGDSITCAFCGFRKPPDLAWAKDGNTHEWVFNSAEIDRILGVGVPSISGA
jgi:hypothetical protein